MDQQPANSCHLIIGAVFSVLLLLPGSPVAAADKDSIATMIERAEAKQEQARGIEHAWTVTNDYIMQARDLLGAGKIDEADAAARMALRAADASLRQATEESAAWQARVPSR